MDHKIVHDEILKNENNINEPSDESSKNNCNSIERISVEQHKEIVSDYAKLLHGIKLFCMNYKIKISKIEKILNNFFKKEMSNKELIQSLPMVDIDKLYGDCYRLLIDISSLKRDLKMHKDLNPDKNILSNFENITKYKTMTIKLLNYLGIYRTMYISDDEEKIQILQEKIIEIETMNQYKNIYIDINELKKYLCELQNKIKDLYSICHEYEKQLYLN